MFNNLFQVAEYYQAYSTNTCFFQNNICTNITGNGFALNGGKGNNPYFILQSNTFYLSGNGYNGIETVPADNVVISNNLFVCQNYSTAIALGVAGYQGTFDNSNIVVCGNTVINPSDFVEIGGGANATDPHNVQDVLISVKHAQKSQTNAVTLLVDYGWSTNISLSGNDCSQFNNLAGSVALAPGNGVHHMQKCEHELNLFYTWVQAHFSQYQLPLVWQGIEILHELLLPMAARMLSHEYGLKSDSGPGAQLLFSANQNNFNVPLYLNSATGSEVIVTNGSAVTVNWVNNQVWCGRRLTISPTSPPTVSPIGANVSNMGANRFRLCSGCRCHATVGHRFCQLR